MASYEETLVNITLDAAAGLAVNTQHYVPRGTSATPPAGASAEAGFQYRFVTLSGAHECDVYTGAAGEIPVGVLQNKPQNAGEAATVAISGVSLVEASGALAAGTAVGADANGRAAAAAAGDPSMGITIHAAAEAGDLIPVLLRFGAAAAA